MPRDVSVPFEFDETGDLTHVEGDDFYQQHAQQLGLLAIEDRLGEPLTANGIAEIQARLSRIYERSPYFRAPVSVTVTNVDPVSESVTVSIRLGYGTEFSVPVTTPDEDVIG